MSHWKVLKSTELMKARVFKLREDKCQLPDGRVMPSYYVMEFPDWVNVIPITADKKMVMIEQYRHAGGEVFLEIPGGSTHGEGEDPLEAAKRELLEETGYESSEWIYVGSHNPNPALQNNRMQTYLALNCRKVAEPSLDPFEDLTVKLMPVSEALERWRNGEIQHSIIAASIAISLKFMKEKNLI